MPDLVWAACWLALLFVALAWHFLEKRRREHRFERAVLDLERNGCGRRRL
jgi:cbb3-type cytochrome oxidase subunit 3